MAISFSSTPGPKRCFLVAVLISISVSCCKSDFTHDDPAQLVAKALLCFNNQYIYSSCEETCRLNESGNINVSPQATDEYCNGPCLEETNLVLDCIDGILNNFCFYNKATVQDIRATLSAGCGYTSERGNFNVAQHMQDEYSSHAYSDKSHLMRLYLPMSMITLFVFLF
ncbi:uncharacterized protein LOC122666674 [Telopea speciosissima]|uniref:uncharacterized protein LOC122666674 n=1 Tax=Telopea speciosissima TaxID=54955 RepID=UPI001CC4B2B1|nr:uncharacterized protein LOC122666674 [Telopea speciosissima]